MEKPVGNMIALVLANKILDELGFSWKAFVFPSERAKGGSLHSFPPSFLLTQLMISGHATTILRPGQEGQYNLETATLTGL